jgi:beta-galactosidase
VKLYKNDTFIKEFFPRDSNYSHLPHPPILINDFVGKLIEEREHYSHSTAEKIKKVLSAVLKHGQDNLPLRYKLQMAVIMVKNKLSMSDGVRLFNEYIGNWGGSSTTYRFDAVKNNQVVKVIEKKAVNEPRLTAVPDTTNLQEDATYDVSGVRIAAVDESGNRLYYYQEPVTLKAWGAVELIGPSTISLKGGAGGTFVKTKGITGVGGLRIEQADIGVVTIEFKVSLS